MRLPNPFRRAPKRPVPPQPLAGRLLSMAAILIFAGLVIYQMLHPDPSGMGAALTSSAPPADALRMHYIEAAQDNALSLFRRLGAQNAPSWREVQRGTGEAATCGQTVEAKIGLWEADREAEAGDLKLPPQRRWRLGSAKRPLDVLLEPLSLGLRPGGVREVSLPFSLLQGLLAPKQPGHAARDRLVRLRAELVAATPAPPVSEQPLIVLEPSPGDPAQRAACGQTVTLALRMWGTDGQPLETLQSYPAAEDAPLLPGGTARRLVARLGDGLLPYGLERAVEGMSVGATRIALIPPALQQIPDPKSPEALQSLEPIFPSPAQTPILQITLLRIGVPPEEPVPEAQPAESGPEETPPQGLREAPPLVEKPTPLPNEIPDTP